MIDIFKSWISSMLCIGIFVTFITMIVPKNKTRKYIFSLIGIVTIFTLVSPVIKFVNTDGLDSALTQVIDNVSVFNSSEEYEIDKYKNVGEDLVKKDFEKKLKDDITSKLLVKNVTVDDIQIFLTDDCNIEKIEVKIKKLRDGATIENVNNVVSYINSEYDIDYSNITVIEE